VIIPDTFRTKVICNKCKHIVDLEIDQFYESFTRCKCGNRISGVRKSLEGKIVVEINQTNS